MRLVLDSPCLARVRWTVFDSAGSVGDVIDLLAAEEDPAVLESSAFHESYGRYSILACRPLETLCLENERLATSDGTVLAEGSEAIWRALSRAFSCIQVIPGCHGRPARMGASQKPCGARNRQGTAANSAAVAPGAPLAPESGPVPYGPGWIGYLGYELGRHVERLPGRAVRDTSFPDLRLGFYDAVAVYDALDGRWRVGELVFDPTSRPPRAGEAGEILRRIVRGARKGGTQDEARAGESADPPASPAELPGANFTPEEYRRAVARCVDYIAAGDIFQVNLSQRFTIPQAAPPLEIYRCLRRRNPAGYSAYFAFSHRGRPCAIACSSPELFLRVRGREVLTRPIKGTRPRVGEAAADAAAATELLASAKDNAELTMIVDLLRNDLGRVCEYGSIHVEEERRLETHPTVFHLVGTVRGRLREGVDAAALLRATFPGGSITGAPKIRAMEIIDEMEAPARGVYTGCVGWVGVTGDSEWNIAIRTVVCDGRTAHVQVGGGIVADSDPAAEYQETLDKARALLEAIAAARDPSPSGRGPAFRRR